MQVTQTAQEGLRHDLKIVVSADQIGSRVDARLAEIGKSVRIPGFRPGKTPVRILRQRYGHSVMGEVLEAVVQESSLQALKDQGLKPAMQPEIKVESFQPDHDLEYSLSVETLPSFEPMDPASLSLTRPVARVGDAEVDKALERLAESRMSFEPIKTKRMARQGDTVSIDFRGSVDGEEKPGMTGEDHKVEIGSGSLIPGFEDELVGMKPGEEKTFEITFPEDYGAAELAGRQAAFTVTLKALMKAVKAEIDDDLARQMGQEDLASMRTMVRDRLGEELRAMSRNRVKRELLDKLAEAHDFDVPARMVDAEFDGIWQAIERDREHGHVDPEDEGKSDEELKADYRQIAERRVRLGLVLSEIGIRNGIQVSQEELGRAVLSEARRYPGQEQQVIEFYQNNREAVERLRAPLFEEKVVDFILEMADVTEQEVAADSLTAEA